VTDWAAVQTNDLAVPVNRPLAELVDELCAMLADPAPELRDDIAACLTAA
jgi:hypothetical protein